MKKLILALVICLVACRAPALGYVSPPSAYPSVFKITTSVDGLAESTGTAWVGHYSRALNVSFIMTAGHVCNAEEPDREGDRTYELESRFGDEYEAVELKRVFLKRTEKDLGRWPVDLCLLAIGGYIASPLPIMGRDPVYGERAYYVGAPKGIWGDGEAPMYQGYYSGGELVTITSTGGASGSALFTDEGVFGVLVAGVPGYPGASWFTNRTNILNFMEDALEL